MAQQKPGFEDFIGTVDSGSRDFVRALHGIFTEHGCKLEIKEAKSGYVVSYLLNRKTVMNYVFRRKGLLARIYAGHIAGYMELLESLPVALTAQLRAAPDCKRLLNTAACNSKCAMGYDFILQDPRLQKCRYSAFLIPVCEENNPTIEALLTRELAFCSQKA